MTIDQLRYFLAVSDYMSFTKAAGKLYISQPALSRHIAELESSFNTKLLIREGNTLSLTSAGKLLQKEGNRILDDLYTLEQNIHAIATGKLGSLNFVGINITEPALYRAFRSFSDENPDLELNLNCTQPERIAESVLNYEADIGLGFSFSAGMDNENLERIVISEEPFCVLVPDGHRLAGRESVTADEICGERFISVGDSAFKDDLCSEVFSILKPELDATVNDRNYHIQLSLESAILQMNAGKGLIVLPRPLALEHAHRANLLEISDLQMRFQILLVWHKTVHNPAVPMFLQCFRSALGRE